MPVYINNMVIYECERCHKIFNKKSNYNAHMNRKNPCKIINIKVEVNEVNENKEENKNSLYLENIVKNRVQCQYCKKIYSSKYHLNRHIKNSCKGFSLLEDEILAEKQKEIENLKIENKKLKDDLKNNDSGNTIINIDSINNSFNLNYNDNKQVNIFNNLYLNKFGDEKVKHISDEVLKKVVRNPEIGIPNLIKLIHFNPKLPENWNVMLKNKKLPYVDVFNGEQWETRDKKETIQSLIIGKKDISDDFYDETLDNMKLPDKVKESYESYSEYIDKFVNSIIIDENEQNIFKRKYKRIYDRLYQQVNLLLINNQKLRDKQIELIKTIGIDYNKNE